MAYKDRGKSSVASLVIVSVIVIGLAGAATFLVGGDGGWFGGGGSSPARQTATLSNAKQVALGMLMYASDWDERFPVRMSSQTNFEGAIMPYLKNSSILRSLNPAGGSIEPNPNLAGVPAGGIVDPMDTVMVFETNDWPDGRRVVAYTDGHAKKTEGFDVKTGLDVGLTEDAQKIVDDMALELEASATAPPAAKPLGMPGG